MRLFLQLLIRSLSSIVMADPQADRLLEADEEPVGVVFEIIEDDDDALA